MLVIGFYTKGTPYVGEALEMKDSAQRMGLQVYLRAFKDRGSWLKNTALKPLFLHYTLTKFKNVERFIYVDADARFKAYPNWIIPDDIDLGVHIRENVELLSGTLFLRNTLAIRNLLRIWISEQAKSTKFDQKVLAKCLKDLKFPYHNIPAAYCKIDFMESDSIIIEQTQASRRHRK